MQRRPRSEWQARSVSPSGRFPGILSPCRPLPVRLLARGGREGSLGPSGQPVKAGVAVTAFAAMVVVVTAAVVVVVLVVVVVG
jgi:hypothetical protein